MKEFVWFVIGSAVVAAAFLLSIPWVGHGLTRYEGWVRSVCEPASKPPSPRPCQPCPKPCPCPCDDGDQPCPVCPDEAK